MDSTENGIIGARNAVRGRTVAMAQVIFDELPVSGDRLAEWAGFTTPARSISIWERIAA